MCAKQVKKLSTGDPLTTHRELYLRNVSSKELQFNGSGEEPDENLPPANRQHGDTIAFDKCASTWLAILLHSLATLQLVSVVAPLNPAMRQHSDSIAFDKCAST